MSDGRKTVLLIAGEASGDTLGAELIKAMRAEPGGDDHGGGVQCAQTAAGQEPRGARARTDQPHPAGSGRVHT